MKVLITGSNGFTGKLMLPFFSAKGAIVAGLARVTDLASETGSACEANSGASLAGTADSGTGVIHTYVADLLDKASLIRALNDFRPDVIIHLAGIALPGFPNIELMYQINMFGTKNLLDAILETELNPQQVILASTAHVYGLVDSKPVSESACAKPNSHYGNSKLAMENIARLYFNKLPIIITRPFNYTGPGQSSDYVLAKIVNHFRLKASEITLGNIDVVRDFSYIDDVLGYYWDLANLSTSGFSVNLCSAQGTSLRELIAMLEEIAGYSIQVHSSNALLRPEDNPVFVGDNRLLQSLSSNFKVTPVKQLLQQIYQA